MSKPPVIPHHNPNLRSCHHCAGIVSKDAISCPHCGAPFKNQAARAPQKSFFSALFVVIFLVLPLIGFTIHKIYEYSDGEPQALSPITPDHGLESYNAARSLCRQALKSPGSAKFSLPEDDKAGWESWGPNRWRVWGWVDSQNSFGAVLRSQWRAVLEKNGDTFRAIYLNIADDEIGDRSAWLSKGSSAVDTSAAQR